MIEEAEKTNVSSFYDTSEDVGKVDETKGSEDTVPGNEEDKTAVDKEEPQENKNEGETKPEGDKTEEGTYDLKDLETSLDEEDAKAVLAQAKELGLTKEQAQSFVKLKEETAESATQSISSQIDDMKKGWLETIKADPEIGGDHLVESAEHAKRFVKAYGTEELVKWLDDTGMSNHPELLRMMARAGKDKLDESKWIGGAAPSKSMSPSEIMYGAKDK